MVESEPRAKVVITEALPELKVNGVAGVSAAE
jgi:hypothetical protein